MEPSQNGLRWSRLALVIITSNLFLIPCVTGSRAAIQSGSSSTSPPGYTMNEYKLPAGSSRPSTITTDMSGNVWFTEQGSNQIGEFNPSGGGFSEFAVPTAEALPEGIAVDSKGNVWFTELQSNKIGEIERGSGTVLEYALTPGRTSLACGPVGVTPYSDGTVWVTCEFSNQIAEVAFNSAGEPSVNTFDLPVPFSAPLQILFDSGGNFWFTAADANMLGYAITPNLRNGTADGIQEFAPINSTYRMNFTNPLFQSGSITSSLTAPSQIAFAPGGRALWITEHGASTFDRYEIGSKSLVKYWTSQPRNSTYSESLPNGIAVDGNGTVWLAEHYGNSIARFDPLSETLTEYAIPCCGNSLATTLYLTLGRGGSVWFTEFSGNAIGELVPGAAFPAPPFALSERRLTIPSTGDASIVVTQTRAGPTTQSRVGMSIAGITPEGRLQNISASFASGSQTSGVNTSSTLLLRSQGLQPGVYYLTISEHVESENVTSSLVLKLTVSAGEGLLSNLAGLLTYVVVGVIAVSVAVLYYRIRSVSERRNSAKVVR